MKTYEELNQLVPEEEEMVVTEGKEEKTLKFYMTLTFWFQIVLIIKKIESNV